MTNTNNQQFKSLDSIDFVRDLSSETAANYSGGACTTADTISTSETEQESSFYSYKEMEDSSNYFTNTNGEFTPYIDYNTWLEL